MANRGTQLILVISLFSCSICVSSAGVETDTLLPGQELKDSELGYLVSARGTFRLGFFSPGKSNNRYLGMWYNQAEPADRRAVWVANRNSPLFDKSGILILDEVGGLEILHGAGSSFVLSSAQTAGNVSATLLDSGNFILKDGSTYRILWQSFDYPTDTLLPGMKLGISLKTGHRWSLTSWISDDVPATGSFTLGGDPSGASQLFMTWQGRLYWISGDWRNRSKHFDFATMLSYESDHDFSYTENEDERYFSFSMEKNHTESRYTITSSGEILERLGAAPFGRCDSFRLYMNLPVGCIRQTEPSCGSHFVEPSRLHNASFKGIVKFGEYSNLSLYDCKANCYSQCSCAAFAYDNQTASCDVWSRGPSSESYPDFYKETRQLYLVFVDNQSEGSPIFTIVVVILFGVSIPIISVLFAEVLLRCCKAEETEVEMLLNELGGNDRNKEGNRNRDLQFFSLETMVHATNNFAATNKLGEGGFGSVYKGKLPSGQEVAVKRLSSNSGQGLTEFRNEAVLIAKLQHTNLVRLEGCCLEREEKMLIYEYMPNKSLDFFLFDPQQKKILNWEKRYKIIEGIGQGLLYLHKYSRLKVIHRDLKASNILLDDDMNPKISDFGMARIFNHPDSEANTGRIVGTYGYMSPEYAMNGIYSTGSDMFSFGVLLLEIVTGRKNNSFHRASGPLSLAAYAWEVWNEGRALELIDPSLEESYPKDEVVRCINVGLLCVQDNPVDRPTIVDALTMIYTEGSQLPTPKPPAYCFYWNRDEPEIVECVLEIGSPNNVSITELEAR
ncbi:putative skp1 [Hibiscus syriacus]|uniref:Receptor-like serine/threonine-protein kinase n=1 Tax=Hibiscus syriacus TaxID=106335 RepID=A0A6A3AAA3_HIBSY|nr:G-type lectin S-receptor-like serine/threonine-protein kinase CES101 [Hibiscus syriacus]KAE8700647.1 putative skp1 [Hibiscus syriacus]